MNHPAYIHATKQLEQGDFISMRQCLADFWDPFKCEVHTKEEIRQALTDYRNKQ